MSTEVPELKSTEKLLEWGKKLKDWGELLEQQQKKDHVIKKFDDMNFLEKWFYWVGNLAWDWFKWVKSVFEEDKNPESKKGDSPVLEKKGESKIAEINPEKIESKSDLNSRMWELMTDMNDLKDQVDEANNSDIKKKYEQLKKDVSSDYIHDNIKWIKEKLDQFTTLLNNPEHNLSTETQEKNTEKSSLSENTNFIIWQIRADLVDLKDEALVYEKNQKLLYSPYGDMIKEIDQLYMWKYLNWNKIDEKNLPNEIEHYRKKIDDFKARLEYKSPEEVQRRFEQDDDHARNMSLYNKV